MPETDAKARLVVRAFDGTRRLMSPGIKLLITLRDGNQKQLLRDYFPGPTAPFDVPFYNNYWDNYTVIVYADKYHQAGFTPVRVSQSVPKVVDLILLPKNGRFRFRDQDWATLKQNDPPFSDLLAQGAASDAMAEGRYDELVDKRPASLASLLNIITAMRQIHLPVGNSFQYLKEVVWDDSLAQDRFFAYADKALIDQVKLGAEQGEFVPEHGAELFHTGATLSYKQVQFGEANVQLTFHESDTRTIDGVDCVKVEPDIDYYKDPAAHALLEVVPNHITGGLSNPEQIYALRWIAGQTAGLPEFDPTYTIEA